MSIMDFIKTPLNYIKNFFTRSSQQAHVPHVPAPPISTQQPAFGFPDIQPVERHFERHQVPGTSIATGWQEEAVLHAGQLIEGRDIFYLQLGCEHFVASIDRDDRHPSAAGIGGSCPYCREELGKALKQGQATPADAERLSLFCTSCAAACEGCGRKSICSRHCLPFENSDGAILRLCPQCTVAAERQKLVSRILGSFLAPFIDDSETPNNEDQTNG